MAYKDKDRQREADRERQRRYRGRDKKGVTSQGVTEGDGIAPKVQHFGPMMPSKPANFGQSNCQCKHYKTVDQLMSNEVNRVSLPGDVDYVGVVTDNWRHSIAGKASGGPLDGLTVGKCSQVGLKASQGQGGPKKGITPQGGGGGDINSTPLNMS